MSADILKWAAPPVVIVGERGRERILSAMNASAVRLFRASPIQAFANPGHPPTHQDNTVTIEMRLFGFAVEHSRRERRRAARRGRRWPRSVPRRIEWAARIGREHGEPTGDDARSHVIASAPPYADILKRALGMQ